MSSTYRRICLSHNPPLVLDEEVEYQVPPAQPSDHPDCIIALGRYSYPLVDIWLPIRTGSGCPGRWVDVAWVTALPQVLKLFELERQ